jgi:hypothetical protein
MDALKRRLTDVGRFSSPLPAATNYALSHWGRRPWIHFFYTTSREYLNVREIMIAAILLASTSLENVDGLMDTRLTYKEYAAQKLDGYFNELHRRFSASGYLICGDGSRQSASIVARNDIVVGAAHSFREKINGKCVPAHCDLSDSYFQVIKSDGSRGRKIRVLQDTARVSQSWRCDDTQFDIDWAIARLQQPVTEVMPYEPAAYEPSRTRAISLKSPTAKQQFSKCFQRTSKSTNNCRLSNWLYLEHDQRRTITAI